MFFGRKKKSQNQKDQPEHLTCPAAPQTPESTGPGVTSEEIKARFGNSEDVVLRKFMIGSVEAVLIYIDGTVNTDLSSNYILKPLAQETVFKNVKTEADAIRAINEGDVYILHQNTRDKIDDVLSDLIGGFTAIVFDNERKAVTFESKGFERRSISEPTGENIIKGSKDSFVEVIRTNTATIRRKIKSPELRFEQVIVGTRTHTAIDIVYIEGLTNMEIVNAVKARLEAINEDNALTSAFIEDWIVENKFTFFPQVITSERPDKFCADIIEGRVGLMIDGLPYGMIVPATLLQSLQTPEDYSQNYIISSSLRTLRFILMLITIFLPAFYISVTMFHQEMIPSVLAEFLITSKKGVPFPSFLEVIFMLIAFEIIYEASLRLPKNIGSAISIVGAIIVGDAAVSAKLLSPSVVVLIALTAISGYAMPQQELSNAVRLVRFIIAIFSAFLGLVGMSFGALLLLMHLCSLEVYGVPYLSPFVSGEGTSKNDTITRPRTTDMKYRPFNLKPDDLKRR